MTLRGWVIALAAKLIAVLIMIIGIGLMLRDCVDTGSTLIAIGSLIFSVLGNTILFTVLFPAPRRKKGGGRRGQDLDAVALRSVASDCGAGYAPAARAVGGPN